uniref:Intraflagellar transport protein 20 homolog n=2 Tax=Mesocestoides corti TaxID=53468 RepID=A0A5K3F8P1_MESCO
MAEQLAKSGLFVDDLNKLRIIDPSITQATIDFKEECAKFLDKTEEFQSLTKMVQELIVSTASKVERMKMKSLCSRNRLESVARKRAEQRELLESEVLEARIECERLRVQLQSLERVEAEQKEFIHNFLMDR